MENKLSASDIVYHGGGSASERMMALVISGKFNEVIQRIQELEDTVGFIVNSATYSVEENPGTKEATTKAAAKPASKGTGS